ncbi:hypothetical protein [Nocardioides rubriscoriae]|uniref:hypothetical protein n=1 Tax=Nocardioides rubriscoriae TaxID=642762 RepID=UPI0011E01A7C|nr:hypothetical protein [Nocardioides rubriscoriae]
MTPSFPYVGHEHSPLWWALGLLVVAVAVAGLMVLFLVGASQAQDSEDHDREHHDREPADDDVRTPVGGAV